MKKKIAVIGLEGLPAFGGAATVGESIIDELKEDYEFVVLSTASHALKGNVLVNDVKQKVFFNIGKGGVNTLIYYLLCLVHVLFYKYDLVHLHHAESGFITPFLRLKYKVIVTFHGVFRDIDPKFSKLENAFFRFSEKLNLKYASTVVSVSKPDKFYLEKKYNKSNILYIPNGINILDKEKLVQKEKVNLLFAAGRIYDIKGLHLVLKALIKGKLNLSLKIAGDLDQVKSYKEEILSLLNGIDVEFLGLIRDKTELMNIVYNSEIFVFPSLTEAMSIMLLEVVSIKTPIIASDIPSNKAVFSEEEVLFFENKNVEDLLDKINFAIDNKEEMQKKSIKAYNKLIKNYTWDTISMTYSKEYNKLLKQF